MVKKMTPYRFKLSCHSLDLDHGLEELAHVEFGPTEIEWVKDDLLALPFQPKISHNLYQGRKQEFENWIGMQSVIFDIPAPDPHDFDSVAVELAERLGSDICAYGVSRGMRIIAPFDRMVDDPDDRDRIKAYMMSTVDLDLVEEFNLMTVYGQDQSGGSGFCYTFHHGPLKVDEVLDYVPEPERKIILPLSTEVETLEGEKHTFDTLEPDTKFICPVCKDHKLPAPAGMNIVELWQLVPGQSGYYCAWCQVLKNNRGMSIEVEPKIEEAAKGR